MPTGTQGTSRLMHSAAAPGLKLPISPVRDRVPSGNSSSGTPVLVSGPNGRVDEYTRGTGGNLSSTGKSFTPFAGYTGTVRTAVADFNGDQIADYAFVAGAGISARVRIVNGMTGGAITGTSTVLGGFTGGVSLPTAHPPPHRHRHW